MIKEFLSSLESKNRPLLGPNYWILRRIGLVLPENKLGRIAYIILHEIVTVFVFTQYMELYVIRSNLDLVLTNLKISMLSIVCIVKSNTFIFWQKKWRQLFDYVTEADRYERDHKDKVKEEILDSYTNYSRKVTYSYWVLVFTTFVTVTTTPLLYIASVSFREGLKNGTELFPHIFSSWMPLDKYQSPGSWITVVWHVLLCAYGATIMAAYDTNIMVMMVFFGGKLDLLRERCREMVGRVGEVISDREASKIVRHLHTYYVQLTKHARLFNSLLSPVMFLYVVMCSLMLCASAFQLTSARNATEKLLMAEYLIFGIAQLFMFCWHSNDVLIKSQFVVYGPYESNWWAANVRQRKSIHILAGQMKPAIIFSAGPFTKLTLSTFITILKGAYSYYTLLRK